MRCYVAFITVSETKFRQDLILRSTQSSHDYNRLSVVHRRRTLKVVVIVATELVDHDMRQPQRFRQTIAAQKINYGLNRRLDIHLMTRRDIERLDTLT